MILAEDRRKYNGGNKNAGRKPLADEIKRIQMMDSVAAPKEVWESLWKVAKKGNTQALRTWVEYRFGKPKDRVDITSNDETLGTSFKVSNLNENQLEALIALHGGHHSSTDN